MLIFSTLLTEGLKGIHKSVYPEYRNDLRDVGKFLRKYPNCNHGDIKVHAQIIKTIAKHKSNLEMKKESEFDGITS